MDDSTVLAITTTSANSIRPVGSVQDLAGCANGAACSIGYSGLCLVKVIDACDMNTNWWVGTSGTEGYAQCDDDPVAHTIHSQEVGHVADPTDPGVIKVMAHQL
jgi:hypothetical protein